jgi:hypothetical protein
VLDAEPLVVEPLTDPRPNQVPRARFSHRVRLVSLLLDEGERPGVTRFTVEPNERATHFYERREVSATLRLLADFRPVRNMVWWSTGYVLTSTTSPLDVSISQLAFHLSDISQQLCP